MAKFMSIQEKIDTIRNKPEHIRLRWAWGLTFFFTFCVILLWTFSLKINSAKKDAGLTPERQNFLNEFETQKKSLEDATKNLKDITNQTRNIPDGAETEGFVK